MSQWYFAVQSKQETSTAATCPTLSNPYTFVAPASPSSAVKGCQRPGRRHFHGAPVSHTAAAAAKRFQHIDDKLHFFSSGFKRSFFWKYPLSILFCIKWYILPTLFWMQKGSLADCAGILGLYASLDAQHFLECILVAMLDLKVMPCLPECRLCL